METISLRLCSRDKKLIQEYADLMGLTVSELIRKIVISKIEEEVDIRIFDEVYKAHVKTYSLKEIEKELER